MNVGFNGVVLVGAGRLATNLGVALVDAGCRVVQVYSHTQASAQALAQLLSQRAASCSSVFRGEDGNGACSNFFRGEDVDSSCSNFFRGEDGNGACSNFFRGEDVDSSCSSVFRGEDVDSSCSSVFREEDVDSSCSTVFQKEEGAVEACRAVSDLGQVVTDASLYIFALKDDVLAQVAAELCPRCNADAVFAHTAGSMPLQLFAPYAQHYGVFYPMQTFSKERLRSFATIPCFVEGNDADTALRLETLAKRLSNKVMQLSTERRKYLHLSAVFACNFANHCYALAADVLQQADLPFDILLPLVDETAAKVHELNPAEAQTGPAVRYDENVMTRQMELLSAHPQWVEVYRLLSESIHQKATEQKQ